MNYVAASDKTGDWEVSIGRGLTKDGQEQVQISIHRMRSRGGFEMQYEGITVDPGTWNALITVVGNLRHFTEAQEIIASKP